MLPLALAFLALLVVIIILARQRPQGPAAVVAAGPRTIDEVAALARGGHRAAAIEAFRALSGCSITESHDAVDRLARGEPIEVVGGARGPAEPAPEDDAEVVRLVREGRLIDAIKRVRELTGGSLLEAKTAVDGLRARLAPAPSGAPATPLPPEPPRVVPGSADAELAQLAREGRLIEAIKLFRERTGLGLAESKAAVERLRDGLAAPAVGPSSSASGSSDAELGELARAGKLIEAIKLYRARTGLGLLESKIDVERLRDGLAPLARPGASPTPPPGSTDAELAALARAGKLIEAIKLHRQRTGAGLAESKAAVERLRDGA